MQLNKIFDPTLSDDARAASLLQAFCLESPIRHLIIDNFLVSPVASRLFANFPSMEDMNTRYRGLNEKKAEHSAFSDLDSSFSDLHAALASESFIAWLEKITGIGDLRAIDDRLGYGLHQGANHSFLDIHIDYNIHPTRRLVRKLNLIIFLNPQWEDEWNGQLELWDSDVKNCIKRISPVLNRCVIFECSDISYHGYRKIEVPEGITRKSFYHYYFTPAESHLAFHDTVFKPRPEESGAKKVFTRLKDMVKNGGKKTLVRLGWKRFLK